MRRHTAKLITILVSALGVVACGGGSGGGAFGNNVGNGTTDCSISGQNQFVLSTMQDVYLYDDQLPTVNIADFSSPEALLERLVRDVDVTPEDPGNPIPDAFSFIDSAAADSAFFNEGETVGYGFVATRLTNNELRISRVIAGSPAAFGTLSRGQQFVAINGRSIAEIDAAEGFGAALGPQEVGVTRTFRMRRLDGSEYDVDLTREVITIDPIPQIRTYIVDGATYGYIEFTTFISTAAVELEDAFNQFNNAGITDVIIDLRYNGGGLVSIADLLGDYLGGAIAEGEVFSETRFNDNNVASNSIEFFQRLTSSANLSRVVFITTRGSASASELVINSMEPHVQVDLVGTRTFGKPVGQIGAIFCEKILRPTAFETVNSLGEGRYFNGIPVDCDAEDDLLLPTGDPQEASLAAALSLLSTGTCPVSTTVNAVQGPIAPFAPPEPTTTAQREAYVW